MALTKTPIELSSTPSIVDGGNATAITIDSSENVGIGGSPSTTLTVVGSGDAETGATITHSRSGVGYSLLLNNTNNGANKGSGIKWQGGGFDTAAIIGRSDATAASGDAPGYLTFHTSADGSEGLNERMRIDSSGSLLVNSTTATTTTRFQSTGVSSAFAAAFVNPAGSAGYGVAISSGSGEAMYFYNGGTIASPVGRVRTSSTSCFFENLSDQRLKENIEDADDAGSRVDALKVRKFDWKVDGSHQDYGMVAQELQAVAPEAVSPALNPEDMMGVDYSKLVPMLVKEIQSLRSRVAELENN